MFSHINKYRLKIALKLVVTHSVGGTVLTHLTHCLLSLTQTSIFVREISVAFSKLLELYIRGVRITVRRGFSSQPIASQLFSSH